MPPKIEFDLDQTSRRRTALQEYLERSVLDGSRFVCSSFDVCLKHNKAKLFFPGQLPHLGSCYDLKVDGKELRILVIGQETGTPEIACDLGQSTAAISSTRKWPFDKRNTHMKGTTSILRLLLGRELGTDQEGEWIDKASEYTIFDAFALANNLMCSAMDAIGKEYSGSGRASPEMFRECTKHMDKIVGILEPTLIVHQSISDNGWWIRKLFKVEKQAGFQRTTFADRDVDVLTVPHPSAGGDYGWWGQSVNSVYLTDSIVPAIASWRAELAR